MTDLVVLNKHVSEANLSEMQKDICSYFFRRYTCELQVQASGIILNGSTAF